MKTTYRIFPKIILNIIIAVILLISGNTNSIADRNHDNARKALLEKQYQKAFQILHPLAQKNDQEAQIILAQYYKQTSTKDNGNIYKAIFWYKRAAGNGNPNANFQLATIYQNPPENLNIKRDQKKAAQYFEIAAKAGIPQAQYSIALIHSKGKIRKQDWLLVAYWIRLAAEQQYPQALYVYGLLHLEGKGVQKDIVSGVHFIGQAAISGLAEAEFEYANKIFNGTGVKKNYQIAAEWFKIAALKGKLLAQIKMAQIYLSGRGVKKNLIEAVIWYEIARKNKHFEQLATENKNLELKKIILQITDNLDQTQKNHIEKIIRGFQPLKSG